MVYSFVLTNSVFLYSDVSIFRHVVILRVALRRVPPQNSQYSHYVKYLKKYTSDITLPFLIDVNVVYLKSELRFHITVSSVHMPNRTYQQTPESIIEGDSNYTLMFYGRTYCNAMNYGQTPIKDIHQLLFVVPTEVVWRDGGVISISLIKAIPRRVYNSIKAYVRVPPSKRLPVVSYSYISDYNTISELKSFVAYQKLINISKVFFYAATPIPHFEEVFRNLMQQGYVVLIDYTWPRPNKAVRIQVNTQIGGLNSAFYRLKYEADAIIICDVDEYLNSETQPLNVDIVVDALFTQYPDVDVFRV